MHRLPSPRPRHGAEWLPWRCSWQRIDARAAGVAAAAAAGVAQTSVWPASTVQPALPVRTAEEACFRRPPPTCLADAAAADDVDVGR